MEFQGKYFEENETQNYIHTHYRVHANGDCDAVCKNEYGSTFGLGWGYKVSVEEATRLLNGDFWGDFSTDEVSFIVDDNAPSEDVWKKTKHLRRERRGSKR